MPCTAEVFGRYDALVVSTAHDLFKKAELYASAKLVVDTRNILVPLFGGRKAPVRVVKA